MIIILPCWDAIKNRSEVVLAERKKDFWRIVLLLNHEMILRRHRAVKKLHQQKRTNNMFLIYRLILYTWRKQNKLLRCVTVSQYNTLQISGRRSLTYIASSSRDVSFGCCNRVVHVHALVPYQKTSHYQQTVNQQGMRLGIGINADCLTYPIQNFFQSIQNDKLRFIIVPLGFWPIDSLKRH